MTAGRSFAVHPGMPVLLRDLGLDPGPVLRRAGMPGDLFAQQGGFLDPEAYFRIWAAIEEEYATLGAEEPLPIAIGRRISVEVFDPMIFAALCSPNLLVAAARLAQYKKLIAPVRFEPRQGREGLDLVCRWPDGLVPPASYAAMEIVFWVALARIGTRTEVRPLRVTLPEPPPERSAYLKYLGVSVRRGEERALRFSNEDVARPFLTANEAMWDSFESDLKQRLSALDAGSSMEARVHAALLELLPAGEAAMSAVARRLAVSTRTLQRKLQAEGLSFKQALGRTREALARHYLADPAMSGPEVAFLLGYADSNSFYRAFRGWTGSTPEQVRKVIQSAGGTTCQRRSLGS